MSILRTGWTCPSISPGNATRPSPSSTRTVTPCSLSERARACVVSPIAAIRPSSQRNLAVVRERPGGFGCEHARKAPDVQRFVHWVSSGCRVGHSIQLDGAEPQALRLGLLSVLGTCRRRTPRMRGSSLRSRRSLRGIPSPLRPIAGRVRGFAAPPPCSSRHCRVAPAASSAMISPVGVRATIPATCSQPPARTPCDSGTVGAARSSALKMSSVTLHLPVCA